jgi:deferrochelatase/peroxidase EfeB
LRVGRVYGELVGNTGKLDPQKPQGLLFMCLNADIDRQFEFVQKTWLLNPNLHGLDGEVDPLLGQGERNFTIPTATGPVRLRRIPTLVTVVGGGYFFLPGRGALRFLAMDARPGGAAAPHAPGSHCAAAAPVQTPAS